MSSRTVWKVTKTVFCFFSATLTKMNSKQCQNFKFGKNENICLFTIEGDSVYNTILSKPIRML